MSNSELPEIKIIEPNDRYYQVTVQIETETEDGKIKKVKEVHLVDGFDPTQVQRKVEKCMEGTMFEWNIISMQVAKIGCVY